MAQPTRPAFPSEALLQSYDIHPDPVYLFDEQQTLLYWNASGETFSKSTMFHTSPCTPSELFSRALSPVITAALTSTCEKQQPLIFIHNEIIAESVHQLRVCIVPLTGEDATSGTILCILSDLSMGAVPAALSNNEALLKPAPSPDDEQKRFLTNMTHELRTPLNGIIGIIELLRNTTLTKNQREYAGIIHGSCNTLLSIVNSILDFSKVENGSIHTNCSTFSPEEAIFEELQLITEKTLAKSLETGVCIDQNVPLICNGDSHHFRQIIRKLLDNALKFTEKGSIYIEARMVETTHACQHLQVAITDTGIGIPPEKQAKLFTPFFQVDNSAIRKYGGIGLGLALSQRIARLIGGQIQFCSSPGAGSSFTLSIPVSICDSPATTKAHPIPEKRILCLGVPFPTDKILRDSLASSQVSIDFCSPDTFASYSSGERTYDILFVDESVPGELVKRTTAEEGSRTSPAPLYCLLTAKPSHTLPEAPFQALLVKPFTRTDLISILTTHSAVDLESNHEM